MTVTGRRSAHVDWQVPDTGLDGLNGDGATRTEKTLPQVAGLAGVLLLVVLARSDDLDWTWWQYALAVVLTFDLVGGVVALGLNSAKRFHHASSIPAPRPSAALTRNALLFTGIHLQPVVVGLVFPGGHPMWGLAWYGYALVGVVLVLHTPLYLARPVALVMVALAPMAATWLDHPEGFAWLPAVLVTKLVLGAVQEEPYRPPSPDAS